MKPASRRVASSRPHRPHRLHQAIAGAWLALPGLAAQAQQAPATPPEAAPVPRVIITGTAQRPARTGSADDAYRVDATRSLGPLGTAPLLDVPNSILVLPQALIENAQLGSLKDALKYLPLTQFQEQQGSEVLRPATRGMQSSNYQNTRFDGMTVFATGPNPVESLQQIEVFSGPGSAAYGPANPAGIFNFVSKRPTATPQQRVSLGVASANIVTAQADLGGPLGTSDVVSYRLDIVRAGGRAFVAASRLDRNLGSLAIDIKPATGTTVELTASVYDLSQRGYPGWFTYGPTIQLPAAPDPTLVGLGQAYAGVAMQNQIAEARLRQNLGGGWQLVAGGLVQRVFRNINTPVNNLTSSNGSYTSSLANGFAPRFGTTSNTVYVNGTLQGGGVTHELTFGTTGFRAGTWAVTNAAAAANVLLGQASIANPQVFAEPAAGLPDITSQYLSSLASQQGLNVTDTITFTRQWQLRLAVSEDWMSTRNYAKTGALSSQYVKWGASPMPSLIYKPADNISSYVTYASSLQQGDIAPAGTSNANTALAPYRSTQWEAGVKVALAKLDLAMALFRLERPFAVTTAGTYAIAGQQVNTGLEATAVGEITSQLALYAGFTVLDPRMQGTGNAVTDGRQYTGMPKFRSNALLEWRVAAVPGLALSLDWQYVEKRPGNDTNTTWAPAYSVVDLGARLAVGKSAALRLALNNATDKRYWSTVAPSNITGTNLGNMVAHVGAPRTLAASLSVDL